MSSLCLPELLPVLEGHYGSVQWRHYRASGRNVPKHRHAAENRAVNSAMHNQFAADRRWHSKLRAMDACADGLFCLLWPLEGLILSFATVHQLNQKDRIDVSYSFLTQIFDFLYTLLAIRTPAVACRPLRLCVRRAADSSAHRNSH